MITPPASNSEQKMPSNNEALDELREDLIMAIKVYRQTGVIEQPERLHSLYIEEFADKLLERIATHNRQLLEAILEGLPKPDEHSHMTREYCIDCAKRDGHNKVLRQTVAHIKKLLTEEG